MKIKIISTAILCIIVNTSVVSTSQAEESFYSWLFTTKRVKEVAPVTDAVYKEECGSCHFAYPPGLLPEQSWRKLLDAKALEDHFGENAELDKETLAHVLDVAVKASAEKSYYKRSRKVMSSLEEGQAPLRITEVPYIKDKHEDVYEEAIKVGKKVKSLSYCNKCHQKSDQYIFDDDTVMIPNYGYYTW